MMQKSVHMWFSRLFSKAAMASTQMGERFVGIDIGSSSIKVVELQSRNDVVTLTTYGELQVGPYKDEQPVGRAVALPPNIERQALIDVLRESAVKARRAVFAMPLSSSFVTVLSLTAEPDEDISARVRVEARKYIPVPISDVTLDWAEVAVNANDAATSRDVLLAAIQNDALNRFTTLMKSAEFPGAPTEIECFSAIRATYDPTEERVAVIDIGAQATKLYIINNGLLERVYRVRAGGLLVTEAFAKEANLSFADAEGLKRTVVPGDQHYGLVQKVMADQFARATHELRQVITDYENRTGATIATIYAIGGGALLPQIDGFLANQFNRSVKRADPFNKVAYPAFMEDTMKEIGPSFAGALGAALRAFE